MAGASMFGRPSACLKAHPMKHIPPYARWLALGSLALLASGCVSTGEPYYSDGPG